MKRLGKILTVVAIIAALACLVACEKTPEGPFTVRFVADGNEYKTVTLKGGETVPEIESPQKRGYVFDYWAVDGKKFDTATEITSDLTLDAVWRVVNYDIILELEGGTISGAPQTYTVDTNSFRIGGATQEDRIFMGWEVIEGNRALGKVSTYFVTKGSVGRLRLKAVWEHKLYVMSYDLDGGTLNGKNPVAYTTEIEEFTLVNPVKEGFVFVGWSGECFDEPTANAVIRTSLKKNLYLTAVWIIDGNSD